MLAEGMLCLGAAAVVPLGLTLVEQHSTGVVSRRRTACWAFLLVCAALVVVSFCLPQGHIAAALAIPWLLVTLCCAGWGATGLFRRFSHKGLLALIDPSLGFDAGLIYLAVGGTWTALTRAGLRPMQFSEQIVLLTAVHFHYAGFALPLLAGFAARERMGAWGMIALWGVIVGVPAVAVGIVMGGIVELVAAILLSAACVSLAALQLTVALRQTRLLVIELLGASSVSLMTGMLLAAAYAIGAYRASPALDIATMISTHGLANGIGFVLCGIVGWRMTLGEPSWDTAGRIVSNKAPRG